MAKVKVAPATQVHHDGTTYGAGQVLEAPERVARTWLFAGYVTVVEPPAAKKTAKAK
jgi:hypothetical protein